MCEVVYLPRTPAISTTAIIEHIADSLTRRRPRGRRPAPATGSVDQAVDASGL